MTQAAPAKDAPRIDPRAGHPPSAGQLVDVGKLIDAYYTPTPDPAVPAQRVAFGTSGHRGSSFDGTFNEAHVLAITQAICLYRQRQRISGPLFVGFDTHALSRPAFESALEVLAANGVDVMIAQGGEYTPTPAISQAILVHNRGRKDGLADGIVITPSHNPPEDGGFKYNPPNGGPADTDVTGWIEKQANALLADGLRSVRRLPFRQARRAATVTSYDFLDAYTADLGSVIDFDAIRASGIRMGVDPLGGAGVHYWARIAERYRIDLTVVSEQVDPTFRFMTLDWDGRIRMDPSSSYAMQRLIGLKDKYDIAFACDTDHDRHGIVAPSVGPDAAEPLPRGRDRLSVSPSARLEGGRRRRQDRGQQRHDRPGGRAAGPQALRGSGRLQMVCRRPFRRLAGIRRRGKRRRVLSAPRRQRSGRPTRTASRPRCCPPRSPRAPAGIPACSIAISRATSATSAADRIEAPATAEQKRKLAGLSPQQVRITELAGEPIKSVLNRAPGNDAPIGGIKVIAESGWFAARPSGTEDIYKIYAESFRGEDHLRTLLREAQTIVDAALATETRKP